MWHFVRYGIVVKSKRTREQLQQLTGSMKKQIDEIRLREKQGSTFPAKESILCNWCYYWEECPQKQGSNPFIPN